MTLIELLVTLSILTILATIGVPSFIDTMTRFSMDSAISDLSATFAFTRSEAIARGNRVVTCKSADPYAASPTCNSAGNDWTNGWITFSAVNTDCTFDNTETLLRRRGNSSFITITTGGSYEDCFAYTPTGRPTQFDSFNFINNSTGDTEERIRVSSSGRLWRCLITDTGCPD